MPNKTTHEPKSATKQFAGNPFIIHNRRKKLITEHPNYEQSAEILNNLIRYYGAKYCLVCARNNGVNIKFKILKRIYFFSLEEDFSKAVMKLSHLIERYYFRKKQLLNT